MVVGRHGGPAGADQLGVSRWFPEHRLGTRETRDHSKDCLADVGSPASQDGLLDAAIRKGDPTAVQALRGIPEVDYSSLEEVFRAVESGGDDEPR